MPNQKQKPHVDLTDKKALVAAFNKHPQDLWASFGTAPLFKDYNVNNVIDYIESVIKKDSVHISPEKKEEIFTNLQKFGNNGKKAMQYIGNVFLRGTGLGLRDHQEKLLRQVIREEIKKILKEDTITKITDEDMVDWLRGVVDMHGDEGVVGKKGNKIKYSANDFEFYFDPKTNKKRTEFFATQKNIKTIKDNM